MGNFYVAHAPINVWIKGEGGQREIGGLREGDIDFLNNFLLKSW